MSLMCRIGRHSPARAKALINLTELKQQTRCKKCGLPMERESGSGWRVRDAA
jgi:hypothetical protein